MISGPVWLERTLGEVSRSRVAVFGDFALDAYWELDPDTSELSLETGKPVRKIRSHRYSLGGAGNITANLAALGVANVHAVGLVGEDIFGDAMLDHLTHLGIEVGSLLRCQDDWQTPVFAKPHLHGVEQGRIDFGAFDEVTPASLERLLGEVQRAATNCAIVILNQQIAGGIATSTVITHLNELIQDFPAGRFLVDSRDRPGEFAGAMLKFNSAEAARVLAPAGTSSADSLAHATALYERFGQPVFVTRGADGIVLADADGSFEVPGIAVDDATEPVGAGDTVVAALAAALGGGTDLRTSARFANLAAAVTVTKLHTTGTASPDEIREMANREAGTRR